MRCLVRWRGRARTHARTFSVFNRPPSSSAWCAGGAARRRMTSGCGWRSWRSARRRWRSATPPRLAAAPPAGVPPSVRLSYVRPSSPRRRSWRSRLVAPAGFPPLAVPSEVVTGSALVGGTVLFRWPTDGRVRGKVARRSGAAGFSHPVRRGRRWAAARRRSTRSSTPPPAGPRAAGRSSARPLVVLQGDDRHRPAAPYQCAWAA